MWSRTGSDCWPVMRHTTARSSYQMMLLAASRRNDLCMHRQTQQARAGRERPTKPTRCRAVTAPSQSSASACSGRQSSAFATGQFRSTQFADLMCARRKRHSHITVCNRSCAVVMQCWRPCPVAAAAASAAAAMQRVWCCAGLRAADHASTAHGAGRRLAMAEYQSKWRS